MARLPGMVQGVVVQITMKVCANSGDDFTSGNFT